MAEKSRYPQIPSTVWWGGVRSILQKTPKATIDERLLGVQLNVQETAAKAYINELRSAGILTDESKATPVAQKWKLDETYAEAVSEIIASVYPEGLIHVAPPGEADRQKVVSWFQREGLGKGAAGNKAAAYLLLSSPTPNEAPRAASKSASGDASENSNSSRARTKRASEVAKDTGPARVISETEENQVSAVGRRGVDAFPLNVNLQIHISADAGTEQIESIFQAMRRYLYDAPNS